MKIRHILGQHADYIQDMPFAVAQRLIANGQAVKASDVVRGRPREPLGEIIAGRRVPAGQAAEEGAAAAEKPPKKRGRGRPRKQPAEPPADAS